MNRYRVLPKTGPDHTISYPVGIALARLLAAPAGSADRVRIRNEEARAGRIKHVRAGDVVGDIPVASLDALVDGGDIEHVDGEPVSAPEEK